MKKVKKYGWMGILLLAASCSKHTVVPSNPAHPSMLEFVAQDSSLSMLNAAVQRVQLDTVLSSGGPYTFFAPSNAAFQASGITMDSLMRMDPQQLLLQLKYELINGRISENDVPGFFKTQVTTLDPLYQPFVEKSYYGIFINGIPVTDGNHELGDGVVQVTGRVCAPPVGTELQVLQASKDMRFFAAVARQVSFFSNFMAVSSPYYMFRSQNEVTYGNTIWVPTDSAFKSYGYADSVALVDDSANLIGQYYNSTGHYVVGLIEPYVLLGFNFTSDFLGGVKFSNFADFDIIFDAAPYGTLADGVTFVGNGLLQTNPPVIIQPDIMASNGVIEKINQVFIP